MFYQGGMPSLALYWYMLMKFFGVYSRVDWVCYNIGAFMYMQMA